MWILRFFLVCALGFCLTASANSNDELNSASLNAESCQAVIRLFPFGIGVGAGKLNNTNSVFLEGDAKYCSFGPLTPELVLRAGFSGTIGYGTWQPLITTGISQSIWLTEHLYVTAGPAFRMIREELSKIVRDDRAAHGESTKYVGGADSTTLGANASVGLRRHPREHFPAEIGVEFFSLYWPFASLSRKSNAAARADESFARKRSQDLATQGDWVLPRFYLGLKF